MKLKDPVMTYDNIIAVISETTGIGCDSISSIIAKHQIVGTSPKKSLRKCLFVKIEDLGRKVLRQKILAKERIFNN